MTIPILRTTSPRLYRPADDPDFRFDPPRDPVRRRILKNLVADCEAYASQRPWKRIPERLDSPHPYHQLYITFYSGMHATSLIEQYAFAWRLTGDARWLKRARQWLLAAAEWEHSDRIEEHFYTANRYMHAFAVALDWMDGQLTGEEEERITACLIRLMQRWWPDVEKNRHSKDGGHHAVVDNGHFGVAAVHLLGRHPDAPAWVQAVIDHFRSGIMPHGCGQDGEPYDGPSFWAWENLWMLHFADALRNVTGLDLYREFPRRVSRPLTWFRYNYGATLIGEEALQATAPVVLRLAQEAGDGEMRDTALSDARLGRLYSYHAGAKGSPAECIVSSGPSAYCYYDPGFKPRPRATQPPPSRVFKKAHYGEIGILREGWDSDALIACISGYRGSGGAHGFSNLSVQWEGKSLLTGISSEEAQPLSCGSLPCVGGQNEVVALLGRLEAQKAFDRLEVRSVRVDHEYWLLRGETPALVVALRRRPRGVKVVRGDGVPFVRLGGKDYLQYPREPHFNPDAGELRMRVRLNQEIDPGRNQALFNTGILGAGVNTFTLGFMKEKGLTFAVRSQRANHVRVTIPPEKVAVTPGRWHDVAIAWGGFNDPKARPFIQVELDGHRQRCDDAALFGELGADSQRLRSRTTPRTFYIKSNTLLAFGGAVQSPDTGMKCDIARVELICPKRSPLSLTFEHGLEGETGSGPLVWKLNPKDLKGVKQTGARFGAGPRTVDVLPAYPTGVSFAREVVPFAPSGLAAGSLKRLVPGSEGPSTRVLAATSEDALVLAFVDGRAKVEVIPRADGFEIRCGRTRRAFKVLARGKDILRIK